MPMKTKIEGFSIRKAMESDIDLLLELIRGLAKYEKMEDDCVATKEVLWNSLFERGAAEAVIGEYNGEAVGFALYFHNFSTFLAKPGIYLEDLFVKPEMRGLGFGKALLSYLAKLAVDTDCGRMEWTCLNWNEPSIRFYREMGARPMSEWTTYREEGEALKKLAGQF